MKTQEDRILQLLKDNPEGLHPTTIVTETGVLQYNARVNGLRERFNCAHKNGNTICFASEHIINKKLKNGTTIFVYKKDEKTLLQRHYEQQKEYIKEQKKRQVQEGLF